MMTTGMPVESRMRGNSHVRFGGRRRADHRGQPRHERLAADPYSAQIGAELGEVSPGRVTHRNGYRSRPWQTRAGEIELAIPKLRQGSYFPSFLEPRKRSEQALVAVVQEAYVNGVSTRKVDRLVEQLGVAGMGKELPRAG
jgi:putative transposase